ncbi:hypothetical protein GBA52_022488 [Prunus armeniaca]|nr:hypothetical protein GBA52_022488 [Prunus armeniaca]
MLLQKASDKFKLYSVIILDEVHELRLNTDLLIGMLSGVISARHNDKSWAEQQKVVLSGRTTSPGQQVFPLKLVLMSATLRIEDFINNRKLFRDPPPDRDVSARQFPCYELSNSPLRFRNDNALHPTIMQEMSKLRKQLLKIFFKYQNGVSDVDDEKLLRQAICVGWTDRVATRIGSSKSGDRKVRAVGYEACMVEETVYLDHRSSVSNPAPEFLVYTELIQTISGPPLMHGVSCVEPEWLVEYAPSFCTSSAHIEPY